jgi:ABC-type branched-subunit amino acid transport system substrate-binding protein
VLKVPPRPAAALLLLTVVFTATALACNNGQRGAGEPSPAPQETPSPRPRVSPGPGVSDTEIRLGMAADLAGTGDTPYAAVAQAIVAYFARVNSEEAGVCGRRLNLISEDDQYNPELSLERTRKLVEHDKVLAMISGFGTATHAQAAAYLNDPNGDGNTGDGVPGLFLSTGWSGWGDISRYPWSIAFIPDYRTDGLALAAYIKDRLRERKVGLIYQDDPFGQDYLAALESAFDEETLVAAEAYAAGEGAPDLGPQLTALRDAGAEAVVLATTPEVTPAAFTGAAAIEYEPAFLLSYVNSPSALAAAVGGGTSPEQLVEGFARLDGTVLMDYLLNRVEHAGHPAILEHKRVMETYRGPEVSSLTIYAQSLAETVVHTLGLTCDNLTRPGVLSAAESIQGFAPSLFLPDIQINLSRENHQAVRTLQPLRITADGALDVQGEVITVE